MKDFDRIITFPRLIFLGVFTVLTANISAKIAWQKPSAILIDYLLGFIISWAILTFGFEVGDSYVKKRFSGKTLNERLFFIELFGFVIATIIEVGFVCFIFIYHYYK